MNRGSIDLKTISYRDVASSSSFSFSKPSLYVTIYLLGHGDGEGKGKGRVRPLRHRHKTPLLPHRGDPEWDHPVRIYVDGPDPLLPLPLLLRFELTARSTVLRDRVVGVVSVPVADLYSAAGDLRRASYQVTSSDGKPNGRLSFSYIMNSPSPVSSAAAKAAKAPPPPPPPPPKAKLYPSLVDLIPYPPPPTTTTTTTEAPQVRYPAQVSEQLLYPAPPMETVVAYPAPAQVSGWWYPAPQQCGFCGYFAPPGSCGCPAPR